MDTANIKVIAAACALAADARLVIEAAEKPSQEIFDLSDAVDRFERAMAESSN